MQKKIPTLLWMLLAQSTAVDQQDNNISLFKIIDQLRITAPEREKNDKPTRVPMRSTLVMLWERAQENGTQDYEGHLRLVDANNRELMRVDYALDFKEKQRKRFIFNLDGFPITTSGRYRFLAYISKKGENETKKQIALLPLEIELVTK